MYQLTIARRAEKALKKLQEPISSRIENAINGLQKEPRPTGCEKMKGEDELWRIRVGNYRVVYKIDDIVRIVSITKIGHRKDIYR